MKVVLHWCDGGYERVRLTGGGGTQLDGLSLHYLPRKTISSLAHALILPPTNIGFEGARTFVPDGKLTGTVGRPSAWMVAGRLVSPAAFRESFRQLSADDRHLVDAWLSSAKRQYTIGDEDASQFVRDRLADHDWDEIHTAALALGGLRTRWRTEPLFKRHTVTPVGLAFWRLALLLGFASD